MDPIKQQIAIAEARGWKFNSLYNGRPIGFMPDQYDRETAHTFPDYLNSLDEMNKAESGLFNIYRDDYLNHLREIVQRPVRMATITWLMVNATAEQKAEAFLRALGLWIQ